MPAPGPITIPASEPDTPAGPYPAMRATAIRGGWYVSFRPRLPAPRYGVVPVAGPVPYGAYGPVGWATPYQDGTIYATDARRIYAYPTYVVPTATAVTYGTGCVGLSGCAWTLGGWR